jgi:hypothetical protein
MKYQNQGSSSALDANDVRILVGQATNQVNLAGFWLGKENVEATEIHLDAIKRLLTLAGVTEHDAWTYYYHARASIAQEKKDFRTALRYARKSLGISRRLHPADHYSNIVAVANVAELLGRLGDENTARTLIADSIEKLKAVDFGTEANLIAWKESTIENLTETLASFG